MTDPQEVAVRRVSSGDSEIAIFEFQGQLRELMVDSLRNGYLRMGSYVDDAKALSTQGALSMAVGAAAAGATGLSAALSSTLYLATADPSTLMKLGQGVGSSVMGVSGIVGHAPFIPVANSLPVVGPLMAVQALTAAVTLQQFQQVDRKLETIKRTLDRAIARAEATYTGELLTASNVVDEVYQQYEHAGSFSQDMLVRLALSERDVRRLAERFRYLVGTHDVTEIDDIADVNRANYDAHGAMLASFLGLRISYLRLCVDMQENPKSVDASVQHLKEKIRDDTKFWQGLLRRSETLRDAISVRESQLKDMNSFQRLLPEFIGGGAADERKLTTMRTAYVSTLESERAIMEGFDSLIQSAQETLAALESPKGSSQTPTLIYWQDEAGEHAFYSDSLRVS
ncbi:hypothetical protein HWD94_11580 [Pseudarthrobacter equi]|uniref:hypothetical protein n=1 Tax=Pseudarthrobacter equi TaxID=728066 RepID=UPI0021BF1095|nr:hypothetical protein [Pseudarthrobacter equi]MCT9625763.1 hypothetical protein [Pseudarthrobacter equi]